MTNKARDFAIKWHGDQKYGDKPYVYHLDQVAEIVSKSNQDRSSGTPPMVTRGGLSARCYGGLRCNIPPTGRCVWC